MPLNLNQIDFNLLIVLDAVLQERSVSRAAARVGRSQPAISHALQRLRSLFGDELLVRIGQRYELTAAAQALADPLRIVLQQLGDVLVARPTFDPQNADREFKIGASDYTAAVLVRPVVQRLAVIAPKIRLTIEPLAQDPAGPLRSDQQDLAFYPLELRSKATDLCFEIVLRDTLCCVASSSNPAIGKRLTREAFVSLPHIVDLHGTSPEQSGIGRKLAAVGGRRQHVVRTNYILLTPFLVQGTSSLAVIPRRLADLLCSTAETRVLALPFAAPEWVIGMNWSSRHSSDPAHLWLRTVVKETASELPANPRAAADGTRRGPFRQTAANSRSI